MTIGIDISPLQGPHRMRGIGYTVLNIINHLPNEAREKHKFVFYQFPDEDSSHGAALDLLDTAGLNYEVRIIKHRRRFMRPLPGKLYLLNSVLNQLVELRDVYIGDSRITHLRGVDVFLQTDQSQSLPRRGHTRKALILYDVIPYAMEWEYLWTYETARKIQGFSRKAALRCTARRWLYAHKLRVNVRRAKVLLAISEETKKDFVELLSTPEKKIQVVPLGVTAPTNKAIANQPLKQYVKTSWGYIESPVTFDTETPFLLFVGGADKRRKLQDLVTAFNHLRAQGHKLKLVLAGDSMRGPETIATEEIQTALKDSSYLDDIIFMGFVDDDVRNLLYKKALAFIFPSRYEGFGLPVLEAMIHSCLVISYDNEAAREVAGSAPIYTDGATGLFESIVSLLSETKSQLAYQRQKSFEQAGKYTWASTSQNVITALNDPF